MKRDKKDRLIFDVSFLVNPVSKYINHFTSKDGKIDLVFQNTFFYYVKHTYNLCITYPNKELATMDDDTLNVYWYIKLYPNIAAAHSFIIDKILYIALYYIFGSNVVEY